MEDSIWWENIIKANAFLQSVCDKALANKSVLLLLPKSVPWKDAFDNIISDKLRLENSEMRIDQCICPDVEPGLFIFNKYCSPQAKAEYRHGKGYARFLGELKETVLNDRFVWIHDIPQNRVNEWITFVNTYNSYVDDRIPAVFILECQSDADLRDAGEIDVLSYNQNISDYDRYAFCALLVSKTNYKEYLRQYLAELISSICDEDVELCAACVSMGTDILNNPYTSIKKFTDRNYRSDGTRYQFNKTMEDVDDCVWETQIKYIFPLIESYRKYYIRKYQEQIQLYLPLKKIGEIVKTPNEAEIGTLKFISDNYELQDYTDYQDLQMYKDARNSLAHMEILDNNVLFQILKKGKF